MHNTWILGGTGFIGSALTASYRGNGPERINLLVHNHLPLEELEWANLVQGDIRNFDLEWFIRFPPHRIYHLARLAGSSPMLRSRAARQGLKANHRILAYLMKHFPATTLVYVSGSLAYGDNADSPAFEDQPINPTGYARQYSLAEAPWVEAAQKGTIDVRIARPAWIIGPGSWFRIYFWNHFLSTGKVPVYGSGSQLMSLIHLDDCAAMIKALGEQGMPGQAQNIYAGAAVRHEEFAQRLASILNAPVERMDGTKFRSRLGRTAAEALCASIPLGSRNGDFLDSIPLLYPMVDDMLKATVKAVSTIRIGGR